MCSGTQMSGSMDRSPLSVSTHNKGYFLLSSQCLIAPTPSCPPPRHYSPLVFFCPALSTCTHIWIASPPVSSPFWPSSLHPIFLFLFIGLAKFSSELIHHHCAQRSLWRTMRSLCPLFLMAPSVLVRLTQIQANHKSLSIDCPLKTCFPSWWSFTGETILLCPFLMRASGVCAGECVCVC